MNIALDFDSTCVTHKNPGIGEDIGAVPVLKQLVEKGHNIILYTARTGYELEQSVQWFKERHIPLFSIQSNPKHWNNKPGHYTNLYIDDLALGIPLIHLTGYQPYVDWGGVVKLLKDRQIL